MDPAGTVLHAATANGVFEVVRKSRARLPLRSELHALLPSRGPLPGDPARAGSAHGTLDERPGRVPRRPLRLLQPAGIHVRSGPAGSPRQDGRRPRRARQRILGLLRRTDRRHVRPQHRGHAHRRAAPLPELTRERRSAAAPTPQPSWMRSSPGAAGRTAPGRYALRLGCDAFAARRAFPSHAFRDRPPHRTHRGRHRDPGDDRSGYFSLPAFTGDADFPEVFVKMVDATSVFGDFWLFHTGLADLAYTLTVVDSVTGATRTYEKRRRRLLRRRGHRRHTAVKRAPPWRLTKRRTASARSAPPARSTARGSGSLRR